MIGRAIILQHRSHRSLQPLHDSLLQQKDPVLATTWPATALHGLLRNPNEDDVAMNIEDVEGGKTWDSSVVDGSEEVEKSSGIDMSKFPGWDSEQVEKYLESGWTEDQLHEWYMQQIEENNA